LPVVLVRDVTGDDRENLLVGMGCKEISVW